MRRRPWQAALCASIMMVLASPAAVAAEFVVNDGGTAGDSNPDDGLCDTENDPDQGIPPSGVCTLRAALEQASASSGPDTITFAVGLLEVALSGQTFDTGALTIVGGDPQVFVRSGVDRNLTLRGDAIELRGVGFDRVSVTIEGSNSILDDIVMGLDPTGVHTNGALRIRGSSARIMESRIATIDIQGDDAVVTHSRFGLDGAGAPIRLSSTLSGARAVVGGENQGNTFGGGLSLTGSSPRIIENLFGFDETGAPVVGAGFVRWQQADDGIITDNVVVGRLDVSGARLTVADNRFNARPDGSSSGIRPPQCTFASSEATLERNQIVCTMQLSGSAILTGNMLGLDSTGQIALDSQGARGHIRWTQCDGGEARNNSGSGMAIDGVGCLVEGNTLGTNIDGTQLLIESFEVSLRVEGSDHRILGNTAAAIASIDGEGLTVRGNDIGANRGGTAVLGGEQSSIDCTRSTFGGLDPGQGNVFAGPVTVQGTGCIFLGNRFSVDRAGQTTLDNPQFAQEALRLQGTDHVLGGENPGPGCAGACNLVGGRRTALVLSGAGHQVRGNVFGLTADGLALLPGSEMEVALSAAGIDAVVIGGPAETDANRIAGATEVGIRVSNVPDGALAQAFHIEGNVIGATLDGQPAPNGVGIAIEPFRGQPVAGAGTIVGNIIVANEGVGLRIDRSLQPVQHPVIVQ
ncbi:MAG: hypothetical protein AAFS10_08190, partial [Myxococcota bacterium]